MITLDEYQKQASGTAIYPGRMSPHGMMYCALKMNGEAGELAGHIYEALIFDRFVPREYGLTKARHDAIVKEIGDVCWYLAAMADELHTTLSYIYGGEPIVIDDGLPITIEALHLSFLVGQIAENIGKAMRDDAYGMPESYVPGALREGEPGNGNPPSDIFTPARRDKVVKNMRLAMQSLLFISAELNISLKSAMETNIAKLAARKAKGTLSGSGDNR